MIKKFTFRMLCCVWACYCYQYVAFSQCATNFAETCSPNTTGWIFTNFDIDGSTCLVNFGATAGYVVVNITTGGTLAVNIDGDASSGFIDVAIFNIPPGVAPCDAAANGANQIACNFASASSGCASFGWSGGPCASDVAGPTVSAGDRIIIIAENYSNLSSSFAVNFRPDAGFAQPGPPEADINDLTVCRNSGTAQVPNSSDYDGNGRANAGGGVFASSPAGLSLNTSTGQFNTAASTPGTYNITYTHYTLASPCYSTDNATVTIVDTPPTPTLTAACNASQQVDVAVSPALAAPANGSWEYSFNGGAFSSSTSAVVAPGSGTATVVVRNTLLNSCTSTGSTSVPATCCIAFDPDFTPADNDVCSADPAVTLTPVTSGGVWSVSPTCTGCIVGNTFVPPAVSTTTSYVVTYNEPATGGYCDVSASQTIAVNAAPASPTPTTGGSVCEDAAGVPASQYLTAACADCAVAATGAPLTVTKTYSGPTVSIDAEPNGAPAGTVSFTTADFPSGYLIDDVDITVNWQKTDGSCSSPDTGTPFYNEMGLRITTPASSLDLFSPGFYTATGSGPTTPITWSFDQSAAGPPPNTLPPTDNVTYQPAIGSLNSLNGTAAVGTYAMTGIDLTGADPLCISSWSVTVRAVPPTPAPVPGTVTWYNAATGGILQGTGSPFNPTSKTAAEGLFDINSAGNYTFYAQCACGDCESTRLPVVFTVVAKEDGPNLSNQSICIGQNIATIVPIGSVIGANFNIYALGGTIPLNASPQSQFTAANLASYGFNNSTPGSTTYLITEITTVGALSCESNPSPITLTVNPSPTPAAASNSPVCTNGTLELSANGGSFYAWSGPSGYSAASSPAFRFSATPAMSGTYTVTVTNIQGCTATTTTAVVINALPLEPGGTGSNLCIGSNVTAANFLTAIPPNCPGAAASNTTPGSTGSLGPITANELASGPINYDGNPVNFTFTYTLPAGAFITSIDYNIAGNQFNNFDDALITVGGTAVYTGTTNLGQANYPYSASGTVTGNLTTDACGSPISSNLTNFTASAVDQIDDIISPDGHLTTANITINYQLQPTGTCSSGGSPTPAAITWWNSPVGGTQQGVGNTLDPTGKTAIQGAFDNTNAGVYTFFAQSTCAGCNSERTPVSITVHELPIADAANDGPICPGDVANLEGERGTAYSWSNGAATELTTASPAVTTTYTVTVSNTFGCTATATTTVVVDPVPTPTASNTGPYCAGSTIELNATGGSLYSWAGPGGFTANGNPTFRLNSTTAYSGVYTVTVTNTQGCTATATTTVTVNPNPTAPSVTANNICEGNALTPAAYLSASGSCAGGGAATITWWNAGVGGTQQGTGATFNPTGTDALQGAFDINTPGNYTYYAQVTCGACVSSRTPVNFTVKANPTPTASNAGPICSGSTTSVNATGGGTYSWNTTATTASFTTPALTATTNYTVTVTSADGCTATATTTVIVNANPVVSIAQPGYIICEGGNITIDGNVSGSTGAVTHVWSGNGAPYLINANISDPIFDGSAAPIGVYTLNYQVIDANGCVSNMATTNVTVDGGDLPTIVCPSNITVATLSGVCNSFVTVQAPLANNDCYGSLDLTYSIAGASSGSGSGTPSQLFNIGTSTVTLVVTDSNTPTASASCSVTVTVVDTEKPQISCSSSIATTATTCTTTLTVPAPIISDNCTAAPTLVYALSGATTGTGSNTPTAVVFNTGVTTVTYTVTDAAGNTNTCELTVTVTESIKPTIVCPANLTRNTNAGLCTYTPLAAEVTPTINDNCTTVPNLLLSYQLIGATTAFGTGLATVPFNVGSTFVIYEVEDASGNVRSCSFTVVISDVQQPTITCPANQNFTVDYGVCSVLATIPVPTNVTDNCGISSLTNTYNSTSNASGTYPLGVTNVTYNVTDTHSNANSCSFTVTVRDTQSPNIICPANLTLFTGASATACSTTTAGIGLPNATDNCNTSPAFSYAVSGATSLSGTGNNANGLVFNVGANTITYTVTDNAIPAANTSSCATVVTVIDNTPPVVICVAPIAATTDANGCAAAVAVPGPAATDNCTPSANLIRTWVRTGATSGSGTGNNANGVYNLGTTIVSFAVIDQYGNRSSCDVTVTVTDNDAPVIVCAPASSVNALSCGASANVALPIITDNCPLGVLNVTYQVVNNNLLGNSNLFVRSGVGSDASGYFPVGVNTVTYVVTDIAGNTATCSTTVTVNDIVAPTIVCPPNALVAIPSSSDGTGNCATVVNLPNVTAYDNCNLISFSYTAIHSDNLSSNNNITLSLTGAGVGTNASGTYPVGITVVTYTAVDRYGNSSSCQITVTVTDDENPVIVCPANISLTNSFGQCGANVIVPIPQTSDNCTVAYRMNNYNNTPNASDFYPVGTTTVTWTVGDVNGNTSTCQMTVTITDNEAPTALCNPYVISVADTSLFNVYPYQLFDYNSSDNCGTVVVTSLTPNVFSCPNNEGVNDVVLTVADQYGNTATCNTTVTVVCCNAIAGKVTVIAPPCSGGDYQLSASDYTDFAGYTHYYIVVKTSGEIVWVQAAGNAATIPAGTLTPDNAYYVYSYVVFSSTVTGGAPTVGNFLNIGYLSSLAACWDLSHNPTYIFAPATSPTVLGGANTVEGNDGGITPFSYNTNILTMSGGTLPYNFDWNIDGYVRYDVEYGLIDNDNDPNTPEISGATVTVFYTDDANWSLTVTDNNACSSATLNFSNVQGGVNTILDIDSYEVEGATTYTGSGGDGSITLYISGGQLSGAGCSGLSYAWSGPDTWSGSFPAAGTPTANGETYVLTDLPSGWYSVTVTDCAGNQTEGWYWVEQERRGRREDAMMHMQIQPNPMSNAAMVSFVVSNTEMVQMSIFGADGKEWATLYHAKANAGEVYEVPVQATNMPNGIYFVRLTTQSGLFEVQKVVVNR